MTDPTSVAARTIELLPSGVDGRVKVSSGQSALTRFANSFIHQNVADEGTQIALTVARGKQVASATAHVTDDEALARFVASVAEAASIAPEMADWPGVTGGDEVVGHAPEPSAAAIRPDDRADAVKAFVDAAPDLLAAGYCETGHGDVVLMDTAGLVARGSAARAIIDGIHQTATSAGSGHAASRRLADLDGAAVGELAASRARRSAETTDVDAGAYEVILAPEAVATLALFLAFYGFNGKQVAEGQSFVRLGEQQFDPVFELVDDGSDGYSFGVGFDDEGTAKRRVELVTGGVARSLAVDRRQAPKLGMETTGHAAEFEGGYYGPIPTDLRIGGGTSSVDELIGSVERGLYVSTFNYCRILDPRTTVTTGLTRNGTFVIEDGAIVGAASNLRFTQSFADAVRPGNVLGVGSDARLADAEFAPGMVCAPSMHLRSWRFTGGAAG
jgi:predicted Zn-dependent protease